MRTPTQTDGEKKAALIRQWLKRTDLKLKYEHARRKGVVFNGSNNGRAFLSLDIMEVEIIKIKEQYPGYD